MMKRLLSLLLSFCLVAGLLAAMGATAFADGDTQTYEVKSGDNLSVICSKLGVDYARNKEWIVNTNKLKDPNILEVGQKLTLPAKGKVLKWVDSGTSTTTTTTPDASAYTINTGPAVTTISVPTISYTLKSGDYVSAVCKKLGIDFAKNDAWIRGANNITSYNNMKVGTVLILPAPGTTPALNTATGAATTGTAATTIAAITTTSGGLLAGDTVSYYMYEYIVKSGDTLFNICNSVGANMDTVQKLNGITNPAVLRVGQKLSLTSNAAPNIGSYTRIVAHKVVSGDTVQGICNSYGVNYGKSAAQIKALNNRDNLDAIKVGQTILIPVPGSGAAAGGASQSGTSSGTSVITNGATGAAYYTLNKTGSLNGTYSLTVNGQSINGASAGQVVHVVATPDHYYKLSKIEVATTSGKKVAVDKNNNFVMPACDVKITVTFAPDANATPKTITRSQGSATLEHVSQTYVVNGFEGKQADPGQQVSIILGKPPEGWYISKVCVTTVNATTDQILKGTLDSKYYVGLSSNLTFTMPASDVYVTVFINRV